MTGRGAHDAGLDLGDEQHGPVAQLEFETYAHRGCIMTSAADVGIGGRETKRGMLTETLDNLAPREDGPIDLPNEIACVFSAGVSRTRCLRLSPNSRQTTYSFTAVIVAKEAGKSTATWKFVMARVRKLSAQKY